MSCTDTFKFQLEDHLFKFRHEERQCISSMLEILNIANNNKIFSTINSIEIFPNSVPKDEVLNLSYDPLQCTKKKSQTNNVSTVWTYSVLY